MNDNENIIEDEAEDEINSSPAEETTTEEVTTEALENEKIRDNVGTGNGGIDNKDELHNENNDKSDNIQDIPQQKNYLDDKCPACDSNSLRSVAYEGNEWRVCDNCLARYNNEEINRSGGQSNCPSCGSDDTGIFTYYGNFAGFYRCYDCNYVYPENYIIKYNKCPDCNETEISHIDNDVFGYDIVTCAGCGIYYAYASEIIEEPTTEPDWLECPNCNGTDWVITYDENNQLMFECQSCYNVYEEYVLKGEQKEYTVFEKPFVEYNTTEGLLVIILITLLAGWIIKTVKGAFANV